MEEKNIVVEPEVLEDIPVEAVTEIAVVEHEVSAAEALGYMTAVGLAVYGAFKLYKWIKKRKVEAKMHEIVDEEIPDPPQLDDILENLENNEDSEE